MRTIYCYHFEEVNNDRVKLGKKPLFKIGDTTIEAATSEEAALRRIAQQDSTSNFEQLTMDFAFNISDDFRPDVEHVDKVFHKWLKEKHNIYKYRKDADREWYGEFDNADEVRKFLNLFVNNVFKANDYEMRYHQCRAHDKIVNYYKNNEGEFLLAAKMRFGKNFTFLNAVKTLGYKNVLVLTYKPGVFASLKDDVEGHIFFNDFKYIAYKDVREDLTLDAKVNIVTCSAQMAGYRYDEDTDSESFDGMDDKALKNLDKLTEFSWDLIVTDECHYGTQTENFQKIYDKLKCPNILYISGTPFKTISNYKDNQLFMYTYLDEQNTPGNTMAKLYQYAFTMDSRLIASYKKQVEVVDYPTMTKLFHADDDGNFYTPDVAKPFLDYILTKDIYKAADNINHMFALLDHKNAVKACARYVNEQHGGKYVAIDGSNDIVSVDDLKEAIHEAKADNKKSITFSCGRFVEGTSIPEWNCVIMLHDGTSPERYFQSMFRGQTPAKGKSKFFVIDYNPNRMLCMNHVMISEIPTGTKSIDGKTKEQNVREWLKAAPIIVVSNDTDQTYKEVSYQDIENVYFHNDKIGMNKMSDSSVFNRIQFINISQDELAGIMAYNDHKEPVLNKDVQVNDNGLDKGKNRVPVINEGLPEPAKKEKKASHKEYTISELIQFAKHMMMFVPRYAVAYGCHNLQDIIATCERDDDENIESFYEYVKHDYTLFNKIVKANVIDEDGFNNAIANFWEELEAVRKLDAMANHMFNIRWNIYK